MATSDHRNRVSPFEVLDKLCRIVKDEESLAIIDATGGFEVVRKFINLCRLQPDLVDKDIRDLDGFSEFKNRQKGKADMDIPLGYFSLLPIEITTMVLTEKSTISPKHLLTVARVCKTFEQIVLMSSNVWRACFIDCNAHENAQLVSVIERHNIFGHFPYIGWRDMVKSAHNAQRGRCSVFSKTAGRGRERIVTKVLHSENQIFQNEVWEMTDKCNKLKSIYVGQIREKAFQHVRHGFGIFIDLKEQFMVAGCWDDKLLPQGKMVNFDPDVMITYLGQFNRQLQRHGMGRLKYLLPTNTDRGEVKSYTGEFSEHSFHGMGRLSFRDGTKLLCHHDCGEPSGFRFMQRAERTDFGRSAQSLYCSGEPQRGYFIYTDERGHTIHGDTSPHAVPHHVNAVVCSKRMSNPDLKSMAFDGLVWEYHAIDKADDVAEHNMFQFKSGTLVYFPHRQLHPDKFELFSQFVMDPEGISWSPKMKDAFSDIIKK